MTRQQEGDEAIARAWAKAQSKPEDETTLPAMDALRNSLKVIDRSQPYTECCADALSKILGQFVWLQRDHDGLMKELAEVGITFSEGEPYNQYADELTRKITALEAERDTVKAEMDAYKMSDASNREECSHWASMFAISNASFKNFHRSLCERFGYVHDEKDWKRDQVSLEEYIWGELKTSQDELRQADSLFAIAEKTVEELTEKLFRYESQADAVVGQETAQQLWDMEPGPFLCRWCNKPIFHNPDGVWLHRFTCATHCDRVAEPKCAPYTPPLKAGK